MSDDELLSLWERYKLHAQKLAYKYSDKHTEPEDLLQECFIIFMRAAREYDKEAGYSFSTYIYNRLR